MFKKYHQVRRILRKHCPLAYPVSVRRLKLVGDDGDCSLYKTGKKRYEIRINRKLSECSAIDTLLHEWGHARAWNHLHDQMDDVEFLLSSHDAAWGVAYAEVYRIYEKYYLEMYGYGCAT